MRAKGSRVGGVETAGGQGIGCGDLRNDLDHLF